MNFFKAMLESQHTLSGFLQTTIESQHPTGHELRSHNPGMPGNPPSSATPPMQTPASLSQLAAHETQAEPATPLPHWKLV